MSERMNGDGRVCFCLSLSLRFSFPRFLCAERESLSSSLVLSFPLKSDGKSERREKSVELLPSESTFILL